jgi:D-alanyl-D-alanine carboxypeptidase (penicillin-binding protein 5/6)
MTCRGTSRLTVAGGSSTTSRSHYYRIYSVRSFQWHGISQENRNPLLGRVRRCRRPEDRSYRGWRLWPDFGSVKRGDRRLILVVNGMGSMRMPVARNPSGMMEWGFREFENVVLFRASDTVEEAPVYLGDRSQPCRWSAGK